MIIQQQPGFYPGVPGSPPPGTFYQSTGFAPGQPGQPGQVIYYQQPGMVPGQPGMVPGQPMAYPQGQVMYAGQPYGSSTNMQFVNVQPTPQRPSLQQQITGSHDLGFAVSGAMDAAVFTGAAQKVTNAKANELALESESRMGMLSATHDSRVNIELSKLSLDQQKLALQHQTMNARAQTQNHMLGLAVSNSETTFSTDALDKIEKEIEKIDADVLKEEQKMNDRKMWIQCGQCCTCIAYAVCISTLGICNFTQQNCCGDAKRKKEASRIRIENLQAKKIDFIERKDKIRREQAAMTTNFTNAVMSTTLAGVN